MLSLLLLRTIAVVRVTRLDAPLVILGGIVLGSIFCSVILQELLRAQFWRSDFVRG